MVNMSHTLLSLLGFTLGILHLKYILNLVNSKPWFTSYNLIYITHSNLSIQVTLQFCTHYTPCHPNLYAYLGKGDLLPPQHTEALNVVICRCWCHKSCNINYHWWIIQVIQSKNLFAVHGSCMSYYLRLPESEPQ